MIRLHEITIDCVDAALVGRFWSQLLGGELRVPLPGWFRLGPFSDGGPLINFQPVPEPKTGKVRLHLDLQTDDIEAAIARVCTLGGRELGDRHDYAEGTVRLMADPEGHEFCLVQYFE